MFPKQEKKCALQINLIQRKNNSYMYVENIYFFSLYKTGNFGQNSRAMNKAELVESVQKALGKETTKRLAEDAVAAVLTSIAKGVKKDKKVQLIGFGTFEVKSRAARMGRNPKTGESMKIKASKTVGFKCSSNLKASL
jgi:DNA-binding protein HU-beta